MTESPWHYSTIHHCACQIIEEQTLWGQTVCRIWLPNQDAVVRVPRAALRPFAAALNPTLETQRIVYVAAAAKVAEVLESGRSATDAPVLLAPMESNVIPLPHQLQALARAIAGDRVRYLLADEVGLGKTIEGGLIMRELKLRGLVRRTLIVAPKGLATQWVAEMQTHFNEPFQLVLGEDISALQRLTTSPTAPRSPWSHFDQVIVSLDSVKPLDKRRGWSAERVAAYNQSRFEDLVTAGWDLVIVDEAHRLGGSTDQVARYRLGQGLAEAAPYLLLLSATPHQGKTDAFQRLVSLLDPHAFPDVETVTRDRVAPFVIRTEKRKAIEHAGQPLFKPRRTQLVPVQWAARHQLQELLYAAVTDYVRDGYNQALRAQQRHIGFLMILMQRLVVSSTRAIRTTLERRLAVLTDTRQQAALGLDGLANGPERGAENSPAGDGSDEEFDDLDGQELLDRLLAAQVSALQQESLHVETLLAAARRCEEAGPDAKAEALIDWIYQLQADENEPDLKVLIFTEFVPTQTMLSEFLAARGIAVVTLNGAMDMASRQQAQNTFRAQARVLVSTDAGGEGLNLQFCHVVINYDIPWNPMRLEQRIGRVDRIGQPKTVRALNLIFEDSVEFRVREVLEEKLAVIFAEFGIDKTGDVLDSAQAGELFADLFTAALLDPAGLEASVEQTMQRMREEIRTVREAAAIYGISAEPDVQAAARLRSHPLPDWIERMTVGYLRSHGGTATPTRLGWELTWPDGETHAPCVFRARDTITQPATTLLNLENSRVRGLALRLPQLAAGQPLPRVTLAGLPPKLAGSWGLYEIRLQAGQHQQSHLLRIPLLRRRYLPVFRRDDGRLFLPTARHIWDLLQSVEPQVVGTLDAAESLTAFDQLLHAAEAAGAEQFTALQQEHLHAIAAEEERGLIAFAARRKAIARVGLPEVRHYRQSQCDQAAADWRQELVAAKAIVPEMRPLLLLQLVAGGNDE